MNREEVIKQIERLYPPDSEILNIAVIGQNLLGLARGRNWRNESTETLVLFAELCILEESHQIKLYEAIRRHNELAN